MVFDFAMSEKKYISVYNIYGFFYRIEFGVQDEHASLIDSKEPNWAVIRKALSPTFTGGKLKGTVTEI